MTNEQLAEIEQRLSTHLNERWEHNSPYADIAALLAEVRRLQAVEAAARHYLDTSFVSARKALSKAMGDEVEPPSAPGSWRNAAGVLSLGTGDALQTDS